MQKKDVLRAVQILFSHQQDSNILKIFCFIALKIFFNLCQIRTFLRLVVVVNISDNNFKTLLLIIYLDILDTVISF